VDGNFKSQPEAAAVVNGKDFETELKEVAKMEPSFGRIVRARSLVQRSLAGGIGVCSASDAGLRDAACELAMSGITEFLRNIATNGQPIDSLMDEVSELADVLALWGDVKFVATRLEKLLSETVAFEDTYRDSAVGRIAVAHAKIGAAARALEIASELGLAWARCESFGEIAAELADAGHAMADEATKRFEEDTEKMISLAPQSQMPGHSICRVMTAFANKGNIQGVRTALSLHMQLLCTGCGGFDMRGQLLSVRSAMQLAGTLPDFEAFLKELICAGILNAPEIREMLMWGFPSQHPECDEMVIRSIVKLTPNLPPREQHLVLEECVRIFASRPELVDRVIDDVCDLVTLEGSFDFLCSERFWSDLDNMEPRVSRRMVRKAAAFCPFRKDVALWMVSEMVSLQLRAGNWDGATDMAQFLGNAEWVSFLSSLRGSFDPLRAGT
jgi:hypothetical protein